MPDPIPISNQCPNCGGSGQVDEEPCVPCLGTGKVSSLALNQFLVTLREDLTTVLTAIWNKVKD